MRAERLRAAALLALELGDRRGRLVRELAAEVAVLSSLLAGRDLDGCRWCGRSLSQPRTGRRRLYCDRACRARAYRARAAT